MTNIEVKQKIYAMQAINFMVIIAVALIDYLFQFDDDTILLVLSGIVLGTYLALLKIKAS